MLKSELESGIERTVSEEEYEVANIVYMYYPLIGEKENVYNLFKTFGITIFHDMYPRARKIADFEAEIGELKKKIENLKTKEVVYYYET